MTQLFSGRMPFLLPFDHKNFSQFWGKKYSVNGFFSGTTWVSQHQKGNQSCCNETSDGGMAMA